MHIAFNMGIVCGYLFLTNLLIRYFNDEFKMKFSLYSNERHSHQPNRNAKSMQTKPNQIKPNIFLVETMKIYLIIIIYHKDFSSFGTFFLPSFLPSSLRLHLRHVCVRHEIVWFDSVDGKWKMFKIHCEHADEQQSSIN